MTVLRRKAKITSQQGILFTDPCYEPGTWCRYEYSGRLENWTMDYHGADEDDDGYRYANFALVLAKPGMGERIRLNPDMSSFSHPASLNVSEYTVGMDTACIYLGPSRAFDPGEWQPACALHTGADGELGTVYELSDGNGVAAVILLGFVDAAFGTKESVWDYIASSFGAESQQ